jgi:16S rRNA (guanine527-N7)-methyltransferase
MQTHKYPELERELEIELSENQRRQFNQFFELLVEWNKHMNLTGIVEYDEVLSKHFFDSLTCIKGLEDWANKKVIDVGTGAGFPGVPMKIAIPTLEITLLDSLSKRINFLGAVAGELGLENVELIHGRAEDYGQNSAYRETYDAAISRAVADLSVLSEYVLPFIKVGGVFVAQKSLGAKEEIESSTNAIKILGGQIRDIIEVKVPGIDIVHSLVVIEKVESTPAKYPRKAGKPTKKPL